MVWYIIFMFFGVNDMSDFFKICVGVSCCCFFVGVGGVVVIVFVVFVIVVDGVLVDWKFVILWLKNLFGLGVIV